jgi:CheY-like chemotaxis protein
VLALAHEFDPDVVLLDIALPEKNGYEIAEEIRKRSRGRRVLLIGISGQYKQGSDKILADLKGCLRCSLRSPCRTRAAECGSPSGLCKSFLASRHLGSNGSILTLE